MVSSYFRKAAKRESKRLVNKVNWKYELIGKNMMASCNFSSYVAFIVTEKESNKCSWVLTSKQELASDPDRINHLKPIANNDGLNTFRVAKDECEGALIRVVFNDIMQEEENRVKRTTVDSSEGKGK